MINANIVLFALAFLAEQVVSSICPPCYTHTVSGRPEKPCPVVKNCGIVPCNAIPIPPEKIPTITIPGPNPQCKETPTVTVPGKCPINPCSCEEAVLELAVTTTLPAVPCLSTVKPTLITKTLPPVPSSSCVKYKTVTDGLMCAMIYCPRQDKPCNWLPTPEPPRPTKITMTRTTGCTVTHVVGSPCPVCRTCKLEIPAETDYAVPFER